MKQARFRASGKAAWVLAGALLAVAGFGLLQHRCAGRQRTQAARVGNRRLLIGYWHNWVNASNFVRLADAPSQFDVIDVAFGTPVSGSTSSIGFKVDSAQGESGFISDVATLHLRGKIVLLSIGGASHVVQLNTAGDVDNFVSSVTSVIGKFGFDGVDIDFEGRSLGLNKGDVEFRHPTTPAIVNLIAGLRRLKAVFGPDFIISMAPETLFVQAGFRSYSGQSGAYLPVIFGTKDILSYVHVQDYNTGTRIALDGETYAEGSADFHVAMTEMLLQGFPIAGDAANVFPPLNQSQVAFGVPARVEGRGFTSYPDLRKALSYLIQGIPFGGQYRLRNPEGYPELRGLMAWSINWDVANGSALSNNIGAFLSGLGTAPARSR